MGKKKAKPKSERVILAIENPSVDFEKYGFTFTLKVPPLMEEAKLSMRSFNIMKEILSEEDLKNYKIPQLRVESEDSEDTNAPDSEKKEPKIVTDYVLPDLSNPQHQELVFNMLPQTQQNLLSNIAYLDLAVKKITKDGQPIAVQVGDTVYDIDTFMDFVKYIGLVNPTIRLLELVDSLARDFVYWRENLEINPVDLKN